MDDKNELNVEQGEEEIVHEGDNGHENRIKALESATRNNEAQTALTQLLSDPEVAAVVRAKRAGKPVKVTEAVEAEASEEKEEGLESDSDDPQVQLLDKVSKLFDAKLAKALEPMQQRLEQVGSVAEEVTKRDVNDQIATTKKKYPDFDKYGKEVLELSQANPALGVEQLYLLARHKKGNLRLMEQATASEKPTQQPRRQAKPGGTPPPRPQGRKGFGQILEGYFKDVSIEVPE